MPDAAGYNISLTQQTNILLSINKENWVHNLFIERARKNHALWVFILFIQ